MGCSNGLGPTKICDKMEMDKIQMGQIDISIYVP
jgi:hypothetical protein